MIAQELPDYVSFGLLRDNKFIKMNDFFFLSTRSDGQCLVRLVSLFLVSSILFLPRRRAVCLSAEGRDCKGKVPENTLAYVPSQISFISGH